MTRAIALSLTLFTGFTGLVYQVTWQKYLATLLGSQSEATAAVLGIFLGGLSVGYALFGKLSERLIARVSGANDERPSRLLLVYGAIEGGIGIYALIFPVLFRAAQSASFVLPHEHAGLGFFFDVVLAALLIGPPAVLMGATIPVLTQALSRSIDDATRFHAFVYGINTVGAFAGALAAGFYVIPRLGLDTSLLAMGVINLVVGALYAGLDLMTRERGLRSAGGDQAATRSVAGAAAYLTAALLIGFAMMTLETTLIRLAGLSFGSSQFTFSMVVAAFVLCIALGGLSVSSFTRVPRAVLTINMWALVVLLALLYFFLPQAPYWVFVLRSSFSNLDVAFTAYYLAGFVALLAVIGLPVVLSGVTIPLIFHHLRSEYGELGALAGRLYGWNTVGSLLGALVGGYALFFWFDLHHIYRFAVAALVIASALITMRLFDSARSAFAAAAVGLVLLAAMPPWYSMALQLGLFRDAEHPPDVLNGYDAYVEKYVRPNESILLSYQDDPTASVAVRDYTPLGTLGSRSIVVNGKSDSNTKVDYMTLNLLATLPALMADKIERAFVIGWGTGVTVGELASLDGVEEIIASEISSGVIDAARHFEALNRRALNQPEVQLVRSDAYRALTRSEETFDLIISEPSNPWVTGVEMLYSQEFLQLAREKLSEGGVYAQWYHKYETDDASLALVLRTFASVFEHISVWEAGQMDLVILGFREIGPAVDYYRLVDRMERKDYQAALARAAIHGPLQLLPREFQPVDTWHAAGARGSIHTLYHPILSDTAGRAFFRRDEASLPFTGFGEAARIGAKNSLLRRHIDYLGAKFSDQEREATIRQACAQSRGFGVTMLASWANESPTSASFERARGFAEDWLGRNLPKDDPREVIETLAALFEGSPFAPQEATPEFAQRATALYTSFYYHAEPFAPAALEGLWASCRERTKTPEQCEAEIPTGSEKRERLQREGPDAVDQYIKACVRKRYEGPRCKFGGEQAKKVLSGE
ncbi:MAG: fused MFS/spermidine synthase [Myxococcota bacterium]|jgi:spermidine synthase|nr:fused MFS/spermidine synthase [Myxococcota bacterium]